jgi:cytochrome c oxidase subunit 4
MSEAHPNRTRLFLAVFGLLGLLTLGSFGVANSALMEHRVTGWTIMMGISVAKALLVVLFFMHLRWETNWKYVLTLPAAIMSFVLIFMLVPDIANRVENYTKQRLEFAPDATVLDATAANEHSH